MDNQYSKINGNDMSMPPPPPPRQNLLKEEMECLKKCLQNATVKTGQVYDFYADARRFGITKHAANPPRMLVSSLGRELEKYDQLCDVLEGHLLRAIAVLQRDLKREEERIKKEETIHLEAQQETELPLQFTQSNVNDFQFAEPNLPTSGELIATGTKSSPTNSTTSSIAIRRPSAISISSLQRPSLPPKLDLSSSSLRINTEEPSGMYGSALASPVTLAPKSARPIGPNEFPEEFMAAFTTPADNRSVIDLTLTESGHQHELKRNLGSMAGDSSDKPIEIDLDMDMDMNDLFGDSSGNSSDPNISSNIFTANNSKPTKEADFIDLTEPDIFSSLSNNPMSSEPNHRNSDTTAPATAPSPATLLAASFPQHLNPTSPSDNNGGLASSEPFEMPNLEALGDLGVFDATTDFAIPDMDAFLNIGDNSTSGETAMKAAGPLNPSS